jgi:hypothetical protein
VRLRLVLGASLAAAAHRRAMFAVPPKLRRCRELAAALAAEPALGLGGAPLRLSMQGFDVLPSQVRPPRSNTRLRHVGACPPRQPHAHRAMPRGGTRAC